MVWLRVSVPNIHSRAPFGANRCGFDQNPIRTCGLNLYMGFNPHGFNGYLSDGRISADNT